MTHVTCRLTARNWDQLRNLTLSNLGWATFAFTVASRSEFRQRTVFVILLICAVCIAEIQTTTTQLFIPDYLHIAVCLLQYY